MKAKGYLSAHRPPATLAARDEHRVAGVVSASRVRRRRDGFGRVLVGGRIPGRADRQGRRLGAIAPRTTRARCKDVSPGPF